MMLARYRKWRRAKRTEQLRMSTFVCDRCGEARTPDQKPQVREYVGSPDWTIKFFAVTCMRCGHSMVKDVV